MNHAAVLSKHLETLQTVAQECREKEASAPQLQFDAKFGALIFECCFWGCYNIAIFAALRESD